MLHTALCKRIRDCTIYDRNHIVGWVLCFPLQKLLTIAHRKGVLPNVCSQKTKKTGDIPLHIAVFQGDKSAVEELLLPGPSRRNTVDVKDHICAQIITPRLQLILLQREITMSESSLYTDEHIRADTKFFTEDNCLEAHSQVCGTTVNISQA